MECCPICKGLINSQNHCRRCRADLSHLVKIDEYAKFLRQRALFYWKNNNFVAAQAYITHALHLRKTHFNMLLYGTIKYTFQSSAQTLLELK